MTKEFNLREMWEAADKKALDYRTQGEKAILEKMVDAFHGLKSLGWKEACYCPKDGSTFLVIEAGSSGTHKCHYTGEWPTGSWWIEASGDLWPSRPILWKPL